MKYKGVTRRVGETGAITFQARIRLFGLRKVVNLGTFSTPEEASAVWQAKRAENPIMGGKGIRPNVRKRQWSARLKIDGKMKSIGLFPTRAEAQEACRAYRVIHPVKRVRKPVPSRAKLIPVRKTKECIQVPKQSAQDVFKACGAAITRIQQGLTPIRKVVELGPGHFTVRTVDPSGASKWKEAYKRTR